MRIYILFYYKNIFLLKCIIGFFFFHFSHKLTPRSDIFSSLLNSRRARLITIFRSATVMNSWSVIKRLLDSPKTREAKRRA